MRWLALVAVLLGTLGFAVVSSPASAQTAAPATFYGRGAPVRAGDQVAVLIGGRTCATTSANASAEWAISVPLSASCGPTEGAAVAITVNGVTATVAPAAVWHIGGLPPDVTNGYALTLGAGSSGATSGAQQPGAAASLLTGSIPAGGGYGMVVTNAPATIEQVVTAIGCPSTASMALYATVDGGFVAYVPGSSIAAVNAAFLAAFDGGAIAAGTGFLGRCA